MEERQVTIAGETFHLENPFMVLATQNPVELHGTYPLAEAQLDRFAMKLEVGYPDRVEEKEIVRRVAKGTPIPVDTVITVDQIAEARRAVAEVRLEDDVLDYIVELTFATREPSKYGLSDFESLIEYGASPRATIFLTRTARARAFLQGRDYVLPDDVKAMAPKVMRHRLRTTYEADARSINSDQLIARVLERVTFGFFGIHEVHEDQRVVHHYAGETDDAEQAEQTDRDADHRVTDKRADDAEWNRRHDDKRLHVGVQWNREQGKDPEEREQEATPQ
jgi:MoxR-like ATPase